MKITATVQRATAEGVGVGDAYPLTYEASGSTGFNSKDTLGFDGHSVILFTKAARNHLDAQPDCPNVLATIVSIEGSRPNGFTKAYEASGWAEGLLLELP